MIMAIFFVIAVHSPAPALDLETDPAGTESTGAPFARFPMPPPGCE
jgi:hypothetical protein